MRAFWVISNGKGKKKKPNNPLTNKQNQANPEKKKNEMQLEIETYTLEKPEDQVLLPQKNRARKRKKEISKQGERFRKIKEITKEERTIG